MMLVANKFEIVRRHPRLQILQCFNIRIDFQFRQWVGLTLELDIPEKLNLIVIDMDVDDFMKYFGWLESGTLSHDQETPADLYPRETMPKRQDDRTMIRGEV